MAEYKFGLQVQARRKDLSRISFTATISVVTPDLDEGEVIKLLTMMEMQANGNPIDVNLFDVHEVRTWIFDKTASE